MNSRNILTQSKNHQAISRHTRSSGISDFPLSFPVTEVAAELSTGVVLRAGSPDSQREWTQLSTVCRSVRFAVQTRQTHGETDCAAARTAAVSASKLKINSRTPVIRKCSTGCFSGRVYIAAFQRWRAIWPKVWMPRASAKRQPGCAQSLRKYFPRAGYNIFAAA